MPPFSSWRSLAHTAARATSLLWVSNPVQAQDAPSSPVAPVAANKSKDVSVHGVRRMLKQ
jgi:hypothetical protein